jgi:nitrile hydratase subunit beta
MDPESARAHHDIGGVDRFMCLPVETEPHGLSDFDKEVDALRQLLGLKGVMSVDELRRGIEAIPEADYFRLTYYQRWIRSITDTLLRKGVITAEELRTELARP